MDMNHLAFISEALYEGLLHFYRCTVNHRLAYLNLERAVFVLQLLLNNETLAFFSYGTLEKISTTEYRQFYRNHTLSPHHCMIANGAGGDIISEMQRRIAVVGKQNNP